MPAPGVKGRACTFAIKTLYLAGVGPRYLKALYHEYTDATFQVLSISFCMLVTSNHVTCTDALYACTGAPAHASASEGNQIELIEEQHVGHICSKEGLACRP